MFTKYFADSAYENGEEGSYQAALKLRDEILQQMQSEPTGKVLARYRKKYEKQAQKERNARQNKRAKRQNKPKTSKGEA